MVSVYRMCGAVATRDSCIICAYTGVDGDVEHWDQGACFWARVSVFDFWNCREECSLVPRLIAWARG